MGNAVGALFQGSQVNAPLLALGIVPLVGAVGAAVDYSRANSVRAAMQNALDATALMLKDAQLSGAQLTQKANVYFTSIPDWPRPPTSRSASSSPRPSKAASA